MTKTPLLLEPFPPRDQRGAALIIGLIMLMVLTLLGVTAMSNVTSQEKMAGGLIDRNRAFQAAEMALRLAEQQAATVASGAGFYDMNAGTTQPDPYNVSGWSSNFIAAPAIHGTATAPRYRIERQIKVSDSHPTIYRVSAIGYGNRNGTNVVLQTTFGVPVF